MKKTTIGGQALLEGLMMIGPENAAIAIRKPDGEIIVEKRPLPVKSKYSKIPVIRGCVNFFRQMVLGIKALMYSAEFIEIEEEEKPSKVDNFINKVFGDKFMDAVIYFSLFVSLAFSIGLFILLPNILAGFLHFNKKTYTGVIYYNLFEGLIKMVLFFGYFILVSKYKDIQRVWEYHGAEHKTINCYESGQELTIENVLKHSTKNARCGTSFMFFVMFVSIIVFSFTGWYSAWLNVIIRLALVPLVAGLSYEIIRFAGRSDAKIMGVVNAPGFLLQRFTTREPDGRQVEVAIEAFNNVRVEDHTADKW